MKKSKYSNFDIHELLKTRRWVAVIWCIEDVQEIRPDLTDDEAWTVLQECEDLHDRDSGFTCEFIEVVAYNLFPPRDEDGNE